jgi:prevent-host-death family protein
MSVTTKDVIPLSQARSRLSEIADEVKAGTEKIITKNGESYVAIIDADRLDYYHRLEREHIHLLLLDEAEKGMVDIAEGRVRNARGTIARLKAKRRTA